MASYPQARFIDLTFGIDLTLPGGSIGVIIGGSLNTHCNDLLVARIPDSVMSMWGGSGYIVTGSSTVKTNNTNNARLSDFFIGSYIGMIILGSPNKITG